jgi:hypothetical protein
MRIEVVKNFISAEEMSRLNDWTKEAVEKEWLSYSKTTGGMYTRLRKTTRLYGDRFEFPQFVRDLRDRVKKFVDIEQYETLPHYKDGVLTSFVYPGGDVYKHIDTAVVCNMDPKMATLHCNIVTKEATKGCEIYVEGQKIDAKAGDLHCYLVSRHEHWVTKNEGFTPRIIWMFGVILPADEWNNGNIKIGAN